MLGQFPKKIKENLVFPISTDQGGLYYITITARCFSAKQSTSKLNDTLRVEIDGVKLREIPPLDKPQYNKIPPAWNGTDLNGLSKTVIFILPLSYDAHTITFIPSGEPIVEKMAYQLIQNPQEILLLLNDRAEDGDKRPWYTIALENLPLKSIAATVGVSWHFLDGDDVKLIVDNQIEENKQSRLWKYWAWSARPWQIFSGEITEQKTFNKDLSADIHYIEFWADKTPNLQQVTLNVGDYKHKRIPTVKDPKWTGDFADDTDQMILARALFGEARDELVPDLARIAIGWTIRTRVSSRGWWGDTYQEVITKEWQYSAFNAGEINREYVEDPLHTGNGIDRRARETTYKIAGKVLNNDVQDPTGGANHYYDDSINTPDWAVGRTPSFKVSYTNQYGNLANIFFLRL